jgi:hypothetical protein
MRYGIRTLLILSAIAAISILLLRNYYALSTYPPLQYSRSTGRKTLFTGPYINCITVCDSNWGNVRIVFLQKVKSKEDWKRHIFFKSVDIQENPGSPTRFFVNGKLVTPRETVIVYYFEGDSQPQVAEFNLSDLPLEEPGWVNPDELWEKLHPK